MGTANVGVASDAANEISQLLGKLLAKDTASNTFDPQPVGA
jgi:hypothetical protein